MSLLGDALFTTTQQQVLGLLYGQPQRSFYTKEILRLTGMGVATIKRELDRMLAAGILTMKRVGNQHHYQANADCPIFAELRAIVCKTFGVAMFAAETPDKLRSCLTTVNVEVPPRCEGRSSHHVEVYSIVRLVGSIPICEESFPLRLTKRERPDFLLELGGRLVGIEHTEAISENAAKEGFLRSQGHGPECHFVRPASVNEPRKSSKMLLAEIEADKPAPGWVGDSVEISWADAMQHFVSEKLAAAQRSGFERFEDNWLLIYDNWPSPALRHSIAVPKLRDRLATINPWRMFSRIYVLDERALLEITCDAFRSHAVNHCEPQSTYSSTSSPCNP